MGEVGKATFELIKQVGETTKEQAAGIEHINQAIGEIEKWYNKMQPMPRSRPALLG